jgi:hypothetical protein
LNGLIEAAQEVCAFLAKHDWEYCVIDGLAVQQWGEPGTTLDADLTLLTGWGEEVSFATTILDRFESRVPGGLEFAVSRRVILIRATNGKDIDIAFGALPFEIGMVRQAVQIEFVPGITLPCCTAEDLIVMKAFASRVRDWLDVEGILIRQKKLDKRYIMDRLTELCELKDDPDILERVKRLLAESP